MASIEAKSQTLWELYRNNSHANTVMEDVELMRRRADTIGVVTTLAIFGLNTATRFTMRSPMFKMTIPNIVLFSVVPIMLSRYYSSANEEDRISNLWRIHENRVAQGMGGTYSKTGLHEGMTQDKNYKVNNGLQFRFESMTSGARFRPYLNTHFTRFNETIEDYCDFQDDMDDIDLYTVDNFERVKIQQGKKENFVGTTPAIPYDDNDENLHFYDIQGESLYTNPPDSNMLTVDHGLEEDHVWAFRLTTYNQKLVSNPYKNNIYAAAEKSNAPFWGHKLATPSFHREEKVNKFIKHWNFRQGLEMIKIDQAIMEVMGGSNTKKDKRDALDQVSEYIAWVRTQQLQDEMKDVYVTDHKHKAAKFNTLSEEEDEHFFEYMKQLKSYKNAAPKNDMSQFDSGRYERGSVLQRMFEPLAGASRNQEGTLVYSIVDKDLSFGLDESVMRGEFDRANKYEPLPQEEWDISTLRMALYDELRENTTVADEWDQILNRELSAIKGGDKYDAVKDMSDAFSHGSKTSTFMKMLRTVPEHAFWDIKKPLMPEVDYHMNPYNPARQVPFSSFFDARKYDQYLLDREQQRNVHTDITRHRRY